MSLFVKSGAWLKVHSLCGLKGAQVFEHGWKARSVIGSLIPSRVRPGVLFHE